MNVIWEFIIPDIYIRLRSKEIQDSAPITLTYSWKEKNTQQFVLKSSINQHRCNRVGVWLKKYCGKTGPNEIITKTPYRKL